MDPEEIVEPSKTGQPVDPKNNITSKDTAGTKENEAPPQDPKVSQEEAIEKNSEKSADPEAEIDSDEEAALREAGL